MTVMIMAFGASSVSAYVNYPKKTYSLQSTWLTWNIPIKKDDVITIDFKNVSLFPPNNTLLVNNVATSALGTNQTDKRVIVTAKMAADANTLVVRGRSDQSQQQEVFSVKVNGVEANDVEAGAPPLAPTNFTAVASSNRVMMNWNAVTNVLDFAGYNVYRNGTKVNAAPITETSYTVNNVSNDVQYRWQVTAYRTVNGNNIESDKSAEVITLFDTIPNPPASVWATGGIESVTVSWSAVNVSDFAGYNVYQNGIKINDYLVMQNAFTKNDVTPANYQYAVTTVDAAGNESAKSNVATANVTEKVPTAPTNLMAETVSAALKVEWDESNEMSVIGYKLYVDNMLFTTLTKDITTYDLLGLDAGRNYIIALVSYTAAGTNSEKSTITAKLLDTTPPANVKNFIALAGNEAAALYWTANKEKDLAGYNIYVDGVLHTTVPKNAVSHLIKNLTNDLEYQIQIAAIDTSDNESNRSVTFNVTPNGLADITAPAKPIGLTGVAEGKEIVLNWTANNELDLVGYFVYLDNVKVNYAPIENNDFVISNLELDTKYSIYVTAIDTAANESASSNLISIMTAARSAPVSLKASKQDNQVMITWKTPKSQPDYYIVYKNGIRIADTTNLEFLDGALEVGESYKYEVSAMYADGESKKSSVGVRMSTGNDITFEGITLGEKVLDSIITAVNFIEKYAVWLLLAVAVLFAKHIISFLMWVLDHLNGNAKKRKLAEAAAEKKKKEELAEKRRLQYRERRINKRRDVRHAELTRMGRIKERDAWVSQVKYLNPEERQERVRQQRVENLAKARAARSERASSNRGGSRSRRVRA